MITIKNLSKTIRGNKILDNLNLQLKGITGIIGPNGAGKSTLMRIIASVEKGDKGSEIIFDKTNNEQIRIGYLPQNFSIYPNLTVYEVLKLLATLKGNFDSAHIEHLIELLNLDNYKNKKMKELSGGTHRRVGIAQALLNKPNYLIIDEPTAGLDIIECIKLRNILLTISEKVEDIIISSHLPEDIEYICNHIVVIEKGQKRFEGSLSEMIQRSENLSYEATIELNDLQKLNTIGEIVKIDKISNRLVKVKFITRKPIADHQLYKPVQPGFLGSYVSLLKGEVVL